MMHGSINIKFNNKSYFVLDKQSVNNTTILSMSAKPLRWVQLHVSALDIGHHQVVLRLIEQLYNKQDKQGEWGVVGGRDIIFVIVGGITLYIIRLKLWGSPTQHIAIHGNTHYTIHILDKLKVGLLRIKKIEISSSYLVTLHIV